MAQWLLQKVGICAFQPFTRIYPPSSVLETVEPFSRKRAHSFNKI